MTVRPSASEIVVDGVAQRVEPRVMQTLVALVQAGGEVVSRDELVARCWEGAVVSDDAVTRAVGQVRRLSRQAPGSFTLETIAKIGYRLMPVNAGAPAPAVPTRVFEPRSPAFSWGRPLGLVIAAGVVLAAGRILLPAPTVRPPALLEPSEQLGDLGTTNAEAHDRWLRARRLLDDGGRDNTLRAEQLLRQALALDPEFHGAKESLAIALLAASTFDPARAGAAHAEFAEILDSEAVDTPLAWRGHVMRGFQRVFAGDWLAAERALANARDGAPADASGAVAALQTALHGSVGRIADSLELVLGHGRSAPLSRDQSRVVQQWLDRSGRHDEAEAEYVRSRDLPGDRSAMELAAVVRALGSGDAAIVEERYRRYRETDWGRPGRRRSLRRYRFAHRCARRSAPPDSRLAHRRLDAAVLRGGVGELLRRSGACDRGFAGVARVAVLDGRFVVGPGVRRAAQHGRVQGVGSRLRLRRLLARERLGRLLPAGHGRRLRVFVSRRVPARRAETIDPIETLKAE